MEKVRRLGILFQFILRILLLVVLFMGILLSQEGLDFRYGLARNSGFSAAAIHPATMAITDDFIATGTQLKN